ncbi:MAG TPA: hypothetical protein DEA08_14945 [Planctomycetes bacterium]|nr:hypothetical protein [Planctomycetota bacterium]
MILGRAQELPAALRSYDRAVELGPEEARCWALRGQLRRRLKDYEGARADLDRALQLDPSHASGYSSRGVLRAERGDPQGGLEDLARALELQPRHAPAHLARATIYLRLEDFERALGEANLALGIDPRGSTHGLYVRGMAHYGAGRAGQARRDLEAYLGAPGGKPPLVVKQAQDLLERLPR